MSTYATLASIALLAGAILVLARAEGYSLAKAGLLAVFSVSLPFLAVFALVTLAIPPGMANLLSSLASVVTPLVVFALAMSVSRKVAPRD